MLPAGGHGDEEVYKRDRDAQTDRSRHENGKGCEDRSN